MTPSFFDCACVRLLFLGGGTRRSLVLPSPSFYFLCILPLYHLAFSLPGILPPGPGGSQRPRRILRCLRRGLPHAPCPRDAPFVHRRYTRPEALDIPHTAPDGLKVSNPVRAAFSRFNILSPLSDSLVPMLWSWASTYLSSGFPYLCPRWRCRRYPTRF